MTRKRYKSKKHSKRIPTWLWVGLVIIGVVSILLLALNPGTATPTQTQTPVSIEITPAQAYAKFQQGAFFLDVRSQEEWNQAHIAGSVLIPMDELTSRLPEVPMDRDIVVVCLTGHRSLSATDLLQQAGYEHISCLSGGLAAWQSAGYPLVAQSP